MMSAGSQLRIGTRSSPLAKWQAEWIASQLMYHRPVQIVVISTRGDELRPVPIGAIGGVGVFTKTIQDALRGGQIDVAVHSLKDLPTETAEGLQLAAVPQRESTRDVWVSRNGQSLDELPGGATVGTGSLRRRAQLLHLRPDLTMQDIRGNVDTRLRKLDEGQYDALVLAEAGLRRLGLEDRIVHPFEGSVMVPAVGQGALAIETRVDDGGAAQAVALLDHRATHCAVLAERSMLRTLRGGCLAPVGAWGRLSGDEQLLTLDGVVLSPDGRERLWESRSGPATAAVEIGQRVAEDLLSRGAGELIARSRTLQ